MSSPSSSLPVAANAELHAIWSKKLHGNPRRISLTPERGWLLVWDDSHWLHLVDHAGTAQAQRQLAGLTGACAAADASAYVAIGEGGHIWWLAPDLMARWEKQLSNTPLVCAVDSFGQYAAVSDHHSYLHLFDRPGQTIAQVKLARPLRHLAFVPAAPIVFGSADFGLIAGLDVHGHVRWQDGLVANVGDIATDGVGDQLLLACFGEGLYRYDAKGNKQQPLVVNDTVRLVDQSYDGSRIVVANMKNQLKLLSNLGQVQLVESFDQSISDLAVGALGKDVYVALANGPVQRFAIRSQHAGG